MSVDLTQLNDTIFAQEALLPFAATLAPLAKFSKDFSAAFAQKGDKVRVPIVETPDGSKDFGTTGDYTVGAGGAIDTVDVTLGIHKYQTLDITEKQTLDTAVDVIPALLKAKAQKLAEDVMAEVFAVVKASAFPNALSVKLADFGQSSMAAVASLLTKNRIPRANRSAVLDAAWYEKLVADPTIMRSFVKEVAADAIVENRIARSAGMNVYDSNALPTNDENLVGFAGAPCALAFASRYVPPVAGCDAVMSVVDPETGVILGYRRFSDPAKGKAYITIEALCGVKAVVKSALVRIVEEQDAAVGG